MGKILGGSPKIVVQEPIVSKDNSSEEERQKAIERQRRGLESNIKTSHTGILGVKEADLTRKKLLGE